MERSAATVGSRPTITNSVVPMAKLPTARARITSQALAGAGVSCGAARAVSKVVSVKLVSSRA